MFCSKCGNEIKHQKSFCAYCGKQVKVTQKMAQPQKVVKRTNYKVIITIMAIVAVTLGGLCIYFIQGIFAENSQGNTTYEVDKGSSTNSATPIEKSKNIPEAEVEEEKIYLLTRRNEYKKNGEFVEWREYTYDGQGNELSRKDYYPNGNYKGGIEHTYDAQGNMTSVAEYRHDETLKSKEEYFYDSQGNMVTKLGTPEGHEDYFSRKEYTYDGRGNMLSVIDYTVGSDSTTSTEYTYDENDNMLTRKTVQILAALGTITTTENKFTYDKWGNELSITIYEYYDDGGISADFRIENTYDNYGNLLSSSRYENNVFVRTLATYDYVLDGSGEIQSSKEYDGEGNLVREEKKEFGEVLFFKEYDSEGILIREQETEYNEQGKKVWRNTMQRNGTKVEWNEYEYTEFGEVSRRTYIREDEQRSSFDTCEVYEYEYIELK